MRNSQRPEFDSPRISLSRRINTPADAATPTIPFAERVTCTVADACAVTGLGRTKLYELIGTGSLATTTIGRRRLVLVQSLRRLLGADTPDTAE